MEARMINSSYTHKHIQHHHEMNDAYYDEMQ